MVARHRWTGKSTGARYPTARINGRQVPIHRYLLDPPADMVVDHINGDPLDNRRSNLRVCTVAENNRNRRAKGCRWLPRLGKWEARLKHQGCYVYLGLHVTEEEARAAYLQKAQELWGEFACSE